MPNFKIIGAGKNLSLNDDIWSWKYYEVRIWMTNQTRQHVQSSAMKNSKLAWAAERMSPSAGWKGCSATVAARFGDGVKISVKEVPIWLINQKQSNVPKNAMNNLKTVYCAVRTNLLVKWNVFNVTVAALYIKKYTRAHRFVKRDFYLFEYRKNILKIKNWTGPADSCWTRSKLFWPISIYTLLAYQRLQVPSYNTDISQHIQLIQFLGGFMGKFILTWVLH